MSCGPPPGATRQRPVPRGLPARCQGCSGTPGALRARCQGCSGTPGALQQGAKAAVAKLEEQGWAPLRRWRQLLAYWGVAGAQPTGAGEAQSQPGPLIASLRCLPQKQSLLMLAQRRTASGKGRWGSGFDTASAIFGPVKWARFSPVFLKPLMTCPWCLTYSQLGCSELWHGVPHTCLP